MDSSAGLRGFFRCGGHILCSGSTNSWSAQIMAVPRFSHRPWTTYDTFSTSRSRCRQGTRFSRENYYTLPLFVRYSMRHRRGRFTLHSPASRLSCRSQRRLLGTRGHMSSTFSWTSGDLEAEALTNPYQTQAVCQWGLQGLSVVASWAFQTGLLFPTCAASVAFGSPDLAPQSVLGIERRPDLRKICELPSRDGIHWCFELNVY